MGLIEKWKNMETKKKLREENIHLREENRCLMKTAHNVCTVERNIQKVRGVYFSSDSREPIEYIKENIMRNIGRNISQFIDWDI